MMRHPQHTWGDTIANFITYHNQMAEMTQLPNNNILASKEEETKYAHPHLQQHNQYYN